MKSLAIVVIAFLFAGLGIVSVRASLVPPLDLKILTSKADVIAVGKVSDVVARGPTTLRPQYTSGPVPGRSFVGRLDVETVLKGRVATGPIEFHFDLPDVPIGYRGIGAGEFGVFFLRQSLRGLEILDPYHPFVEAGPGLGRGTGSLLDRVVAEIGHLFDYRASTRNAKVEAVLTLRTVDAPAAAAALKVAARDSDVSVRILALDTLLDLGDTSVLDAIEPIVFSSAGRDDGLMTGVGGALREVRDPRTIPALGRLLRAPNVWVRRGAVAALRNTHDFRALRPLAESLYDPDHEVRYYAVVGLGELTGQNQWTPSIANFNQNEKKFLEHWRDWARQLKPPVGPQPQNPAPSATEPNH